MPFFFSWKLKNNKVFLKRQYSEIPINSIALNISNTLLIWEYAVILIWFGWYHSIDYYNSTSSLLQDWDTKLRSGACVKLDLGPARFKLHLNLVLANVLTNGCRCRFASHWNCQITGLTKALSARFRQVTLTTGWPTKKYLIYSHPEFSWQS